MKTFFLTATGNSLAVAKHIGGDLIPIPQVIRQEKLEYEDDVIGLVFPTYCCNVPLMIRRFLDKATLKAEYLFAVATYGNSMGTGGDGNEMQEFERYASSHGQHFHYINSILMVDNYVDIFEMEKEIKRIPSKKIDEHVSVIIADITARKMFVKSTNGLGRFFTWICRPMVKSQDKLLNAKKFIVDDNCIACDICSQVCPSGNITIDKKPSFGDNCYKCYACIHACPQNAIHLKNERSSVRWRNPDVSLKEIIAANKQY